MSDVRKFVKQSSGYFVTQVIALLLSVVTFPIFTRFLSKEEYGWMSILSGTMLIMVLVFSGNLKDGILRFYGEYRDRNEVDLLISNTFYGTLAFTTIGVVLSIGAAAWWCTANPPSRPFYVVTFMLSLLIVLVRNLFLQVQTANRVMDRVLQYNRNFLVYRGLSTAAAVVFAVFLSMGLAGMFLGHFMTEAAVLMTLLGPFFRRNRVQIRNFSRKALLIPLRYSAPLIVASLSELILNFGDRYIIALFLGQEAVANYSVAYAIPDYIQNTIVFSFNLSLYPSIMTLWGQRRTSEADVLINKFLSLYLLIAVPIAFGIVAIRHELMPLVASSKYAESSQYLAILTVGIMLRGLYFPLAAGLYREKKTSVLAAVNGVGMVLNIGLNFLLIPRFQLYGAAFATMLSYMFVLAGCYRYARQIQRVSAEVAQILRYLVIALVMYVSVRYVPVPFDDLLIKTMVKVLVGSVIYSCGVYLVDKNVKSLVCLMLNRGSVSAS